MANFLFSAYFGGHFFTIATVKVIIIRDFYTLALFLINYKKKFVKNNFNILASCGAKKPLNARSSFVIACLSKSMTKHDYAPIED